MFQNVTLLIKGLTFLIILLFFIFLLSRGKVYSKDELEYGVTFSKKQATELGIDWKEMYLDILDDLKVKKLRLPAYWNEIEKKSGVYLWNDLDWQMAEAGKRGVDIILAVGGRLPRWPECHFPKWAEALPKKEREKNILLYIDKTVKRYRDNNNIKAWQVENEPFLTHFGECPKLNRRFLDEEIALVRELDKRPVVVTDSGELSFWVSAARRADIFGTTMYRDTYSNFLKRYVHYPIKPGFFRFKKNLVRLFASPEDMIVIELQAEPWTPEPYQNVTKAERDRTMNLEKFREILEFSRKAGFREFYLWGVEWWHWEREVNNDASIWNEARALFK